MACNIFSTHRTYNMPIRNKRHRLMAVPLVPYIRNKEKNVSTNIMLYPNDVHIIATFPCRYKHFLQLFRIFVGADNLRCEHKCFSCKYANQNAICINSATRHRISAQGTYRYLPDKCHSFPWDSSVPLLTCLIRMSLRMTQNQETAPRVAPKGMM